MPKHKRKKKLIRSRLQLRMIAVFLSLSVASALFQVVLLNRSLLKMATKLDADMAVVSQMLYETLVTNLVLTLVVLVPLMILIGILATHRVAGPAYRMTQYCKSIAQGEAPTVCRIRKHDELHELCAALNSAFAAVAPPAPRTRDNDAGATLEEQPSLLPSLPTAAAAASEHAP